MGGHQVGSALTGHTGYVFAIALTSDDSQIVTAGDDGTIRIWDRVGGHQVGSALTGHTRRVRALAVTSDNTRIITGGEDGTIRIWDLASGRQVAGTESVMAPPIQVDPHSGVVSDVESATDQLGIARDVDSVAALLAARDTAPPLSVALLGDWGSGKSSFMQQVINRVDSFADASRRNPRASAYAAEVLQVRFNAWHYNDDHLWVGLVEHLFRELADRRRDSKDDGGQRAAMEAQLASEEAKREQLTDDLTAVARIGHDERWFGWLTRLSRVFLVLRVASRSVWAEIGRPRRLFSGALLVLAVGLIVALTVYGHTIFGWVAGVITAAVGLLSPVVPVWRHVDTIIEKIRSKLQEQRNATEKKIEKLAGQLDRIDPARRLENLLVEISSPERYEQYRGIVGRIRQDLDRISEELAAAQDEWARGESDDAPPLQRIVLYVDDLDRCTAARVVQVLQAVNLLLGMSLFIVVVAVDPRWLLTALEDQYPTELGNDKRHERSLGFLDKIFHVAYAVRPMGNRATGYLRGLLPPMEDGDSAREKDQRSLSSPQTSESQAENATQVASIAQGEIVEENSDADLGHKSPMVRRRPLTIDLSRRVLRLHSIECKFLPYLAPLLPTPRAVKKLTNLYRLLRISVPDDQLDNFLGDEEGGPYQAAALLLAVVISSPAQAESFLAELIAAEPGPDITDTLANFDNSDLTVDLTKRIKEIRKELPVYGDSSSYQEWSVLVARYSFETYRLFSV